MEAGWFLWFMVCQKLLWIFKFNTLHLNKKYSFVFLPLNIELLMSKEYDLNWLEFIADAKRLDNRSFGLKPSNFINTLQFSQKK